MYFFWQRVNAPELLRLYMNYDLLIEAVTLAVEYIQAVLGNGKEYFGLKVNSLTTMNFVPYLILYQRKTSSEILNTISERFERFRLSYRQFPAWYRSFLAGYQFLFKKWPIIDLF